MEPKISPTWLHTKVIISLVMCVLYIDTKSQCWAEEILWRGRTATAFSNGPGDESTSPNHFGRYEWVVTQRSIVSERVVSDEKGRTWYLKTGRAVKGEVAAAYLLWGLGYFVEPIYYLDQITVSGKLIQSVSLRLRPTQRVPERHWGWSQNPFVGTSQLEGLALLMSVMSTSSRGNDGNIVVLNSSTGDRTFEVWNLRGSFTPDPNHEPRPDEFASEDWSPEIKHQQLKLKHTGPQKSIRVTSAEWLVKAFSVVADDGIEEIFKSAGFSSLDAQSYRRVLRRRIEMVRTLVEGTRS